ncbi:UNVERIFIED_CONTAM: hypothetical protein FKN15_010396 [Acipenser sinensis]
MQIQELLKSLGAQGSLRFPDFEEIRKYVHSLSTSSLIGLGAFATLTAYWLATRPRPIQAPCDLEHQSVPVQDCGGSGLNKDTKTAYEMFQRGLRISGEGPCLGFRKPKGPYEWISYKEVSDQAEFLGSGLLHRGCLPSPDQFIGVFAQNRPEVPNSEISMVICDKPEKAGTLLTNVEQSLTPGLKTIILMNSCDAALLERGRNCGVEILQFRDIMEQGRQNHKAPVPPRPEDLAVVCFTSGTTGKPKGAMITHGNIASNTSSVIKILEGSFVIRQEDVTISYLPLAHMFERMIQGNLIPFHPVSQSHLIGIVVPDPEVFTGWAQEKGIVGSYDELCRNQEVKKAILEDLTRLGKEAGLKSFEQVKDLYIHPEIFSICNGLLTPTMKARRADIRKRFQGQISRLYSKSAF